MKSKNRIRIYSLFILGMLLILIPGCKEDDEPSNSLIGSWKETNSTLSDCADPIDNWTGACSAPDCGTITFTETTVDVDGDSYTYTKSGSSLNINYSSSIIFVVTYSISGSTLIITEQDDPDDCKSVTTYTKL